MLYPTTTPTARTTSPIHSSAHPTKVDPDVELPEPPWTVLHPISKQSPLHYAARRGKSRIAEHLLEKGADPTLLDRRGATPFWYACRAGFLETARVLANDIGSGELRRPADDHGVLLTPSQAAFDNHHDHVGKWIDEELKRRVTMTTRK